jgi:hydroxymethylbilane synthase
LIRIGTRSSALALAQAHWVASRLSAATELVTISTRGDRGGDDPGDKSRWISDLERALLEGEIDVAVHSAKDVPAELAEGLEVLAIPERADPYDVICGAESLTQLRPGARVGTSSLRRMAQLRALRGDIDVVAIRGNVDTRLRKLGDGTGRLSALVLALAGLERLERTAQAGGVLDPERFVPAPGQGVLALEARAHDRRVRERVAEVNDGATFACLTAERTLAAQLGASCNSALGAYATADGGRLRLRGWVGLADGSSWCRDVLDGEIADPAELGRAVAERMAAAGAIELLGARDSGAAVGG